MCPTTPQARQTLYAELANQGHLAPETHRRMQKCKPDCTPPSSQGPDTLARGDEFRALHLQEKAAKTKTATKEIAASSIPRAMPCLAHWIPPLS